MVNKVILIGNVGADPEAGTIGGGDMVANIRLATTERYKNKNGEKVEQTEWHNIVLWRGLAEIVDKYVKKGMRLYIEGKIHTRSWEDKSGNKRYTTEIYADNMQMLSSQPSGNTPAKDDSTTEKSYRENNHNSEPADDLPF
jgi:single-strand DNA-binding protein